MSNSNNIKERGRVRQLIARVESPIYFTVVLLVMADLMKHFTRNATTRVA